MKNAQTNERPEAIARIYEAASNLLMPPLSSLHQTFVETKAGVNKERSRLRRELDEIRDEGFEAAARLMLPDTEKLQSKAGSYIERIQSNQE